MSDEFETALAARIANTSRLESENAEWKRKAAALSADAMRASRAIGERDQRLKLMAAVQDENDQLQKQVTDLAAQLKATNRALDEAVSQVAADADKVARATAITDAVAEAVEELDGASR